MAYWTAAAQQAGMASRIESARHPRDILERVSAAERELLVRTLVAGLRELPSMWTGSEAFGTIISDLDPPMFLHGVPMNLDSELSATPAGEALAQMRKYAGLATVHRECRRTYESPQAIEDRKRLKREKMAIAHARRQSESQRKNAERLELLGVLAGMSPVERLSQLATDPTIKLGCVSAELIPAQEGDLIGLEKATAIALVKRIDRRRGAWGRRRRMLEHLIETHG